MIALSGDGMDNDSSGTAWMIASSGDGMDNTIIGRRGESELWQQPTMLFSCFGRATKQQNKPPILLSISVHDNKQQITQPQQSSISSLLTSPATHR